MDYNGLSNRYRTLVEQRLTGQLERVSHPKLKQAMGHLLGRGKVFRPLLALACCVNEGCADPGEYVSLVTPLEMIHTFTLIHDDLPCMDDAPLRRNVPSVHIEHGEAEAVLSGDALLNYALNCLVEEGGNATATQRLGLLREATWATHLVVEGQMLDIELEGVLCTLEQLQQLHYKKTGALLAACCVTGAILCGCSDQRVTEYREFGRKLGLLFQIRDDLLSIESTDEQMGKTLSSDEIKEKSTYPRILGHEQARMMLEREKQELLNLATDLTGKAPELLTDIVEFTAGRSN